jgi:hypothetical protein
MRLHRFESLVPGFPLLLGGHCTRRGSLYPGRRVRRERSNRARARVSSRYMHLFKARRAIPPGTKSATRNGWANFLFRSASGHATRHIGISSYYMHIHTFICARARARGPPLSARFLARLLDSPREKRQSDDRRRMREREQTLCSRRNSPPSLHPRESRLGDQRGWRCPGEGVWRNTRARARFARL